MREGPDDADRSRHPAVAGSGDPPVHLTLEELAPVTLAQAVAYVPFDDVDAAAAERNVRQIRSWMALNEVPIP